MTATPRTPPGGHGLGGGVRMSGASPDDNEEVPATGVLPCIVRRNARVAATLQQQIKRRRGR